MADLFIRGLPQSITARYFSAYPSDSASRRTPCPPKHVDRWLQVRLACFRLSPSCPMRRLHTFLSLRPARHYPRFWIRRSSSERRRDFNPPDSCAAQRTLRNGPPQCFASVLSPHGFRRLGFSLAIEATGSRSSTQKPVLASRPLYAGRRPPSHQAPGGLVPGDRDAPGFGDGSLDNDASSKGSLAFVSPTRTCPR